MHPPLGASHCAPLVQQANGTADMAEEAVHTPRGPDALGPAAAAAPDQQPADRPVQRCCKAVDAPADAAHDNCTAERSVWRCRTRQARAWQRL